MTVTERNLYVLCFASREGIRILESGKFLLVEYRILDFEILNTVQESEIPLTIGIWNPMTKNPGLQFWNPESTVYNRESI